MTMSTGSQPPFSLLKTPPEEQAVDMLVRISAQSPTGICSPLTHVKYEEAERANSDWSDLLPIPCYVIPLMLILIKAKLRDEMKMGRTKQFHRWVSHSNNPWWQPVVYHTSCQTLGIREWMRPKSVPKTLIVITTGCYGNTKKGLIG